MKARTRKLLSLLLTLCMVIGLLPGMALTAAAASDPYVTVNNNVYLSAAKPYYVNGKAQAADPGDATFGSNGYTAKLTLNGTDATLTLKNYNGGRISYRYGNLTVVVNDSNVIDSTRYEGIGASGNLTVQGTPSGEAKNDSLTVTSVNGCISADGDLTIQNLQELNCSSTATNNNCVKGNGTLTLQHIGTARLSLPNAGGGYAALLGRTSVIVNDVDDLETSCGGDAVYSSSSARGDISITAAKAALYSKWGSAICNYGGNVTVNVDTLIAVTDGGTAIRAANYSSTSGDVSASVTATSGLYVKGAVIQSSDNPTVKLNGNDVEKTNGVYSGTPGGTTTGTATISIADGERTKTYSGQPVTVDVTSSVDGLTYIYTWYDKDGKPLGGTAPVDVGNYKLRVYAYGTVGSVAYTGDTGAELIGVTISRVAAPAEYEKTVNANITNGNNLITLPEIPSGMGFGTPVRCDAAGNVWSAPDGVTLIPTLSGNLLSVQASNLGSTAYYYVKVPVNAGSKSNYEDYAIILTLTNLTDKAIFDRCDGSEPAVITIGTDLPDTTLYSAKAGSENPDGAWEVAIGEAIMYGYEFAGWYTAPNGWGTQVSDKDGYAVNGDGTTKKDESGNPIAATFTPGTTYYAKWVWTYGYVGAEPIDGNYYNVNYVYGVLSTPRTVYTTCLDFTNAEKLGIRVGGDGYTFDGASKILTLDGVHIQALDSVCGIILPAESTIKVVSMPENSYKNFYKYQEGHEETKTSADDYKTSGYSKASNIISCGSVDATADVFCLGSLTILSDATNAETSEVGLGNWLDAKQGGIRTAADGTLTVKNANIDTTRLHADGAITVYDSLIFATNYSSTFTGDRYVRSYNGSVTIQDGWVFTEWLQAETNLSISGRVSRIRASFGASAGEKITISNSGYKNASGDNFALDFGNEENALWGLYAKNVEISGSLLNSASIMTEGALTVSGGSEVNAHSSQMALPICIYGGGSISNSTVNVTEVDSGSVGIYSTGPLTINSSTVTVTKANAATPAAAILVIAPETGTGLVLNSSAITVPSGGTVEKMVPTENNDDKTALWFIVESNRTSIANEVTISPVGPAYEDFSDLEESAWYHDGIAYVLEKGIMNGVGDGKFAPNVETSCAMVATILWRLAGSPQAGASGAFTDVASGTWYSDAAAWAAENGIANGNGGAFDPNGAITREQLAYMLYRYAQSQGKGFTGQWMFPLDYTDADSVSGWAYEAMCWMTMNGVVNGKGGGVLDPQGMATRAEAAAMLQRFSESVK